MNEGEGVSANENVFMARSRRCIYEGENVFMKVSALTKMYSV